MPRHYIPKYMRPDYWVEPPKRSLANRYNHMTDKELGTFYPAHGPMSKTTTRAWKFRNGSNPCCCCTKQDFLEFFQFADAMGCCVFRKVRPGEGGKSCIHNTLLIPYTKVPGMRQALAKRMRGRGTHWTYNTVAHRGPSPRGKYWPEHGPHVLPFDEPIEKPTVKIRKYNKSWRQDGAKFLDD